MRSNFFAILRSLFYLDGWLVLAAGLLTVFGTAAVYSVDLSRGEEFATLKKHIIIIIVGIILFFIVSQVDYTFFRASAIWWYIISLILLSFVLFFGATVRGTTGWFRVGDFSFQPAEFAKIGLVLMLAYFLSRRKRDLRNSSAFVGSLLVVLFLQILILLQPDLGTALILGLCWLGTVLFSSTKKRYWLIFFAVVAAIGLLAWGFLLKDYQKNRLLTFFNLKRDPLGAGYNVSQSIIAIGSGQLLGRGLGFGSQSQLRFLPEAQSDFIFAVIGEELGFVGSTVLLLLFGLMFLRMIILLPAAPDDFAALLVLGVCLLLFVQFLINVGGTLGLSPVTGVTLPLVSAGGSSFLATMFMLGMVQSIYRRVRLTRLSS
jgi:rod shape determining protein RodA